MQINPTNKENKNIRMTIMLMITMAIYIIYIKHFMWNTFASVCTCSPYRDCRCQFYSKDKTRWYTYPAIFWDASIPVSDGGTHHRILVSIFLTACLCGNNRNIRIVIGCFMVIVVTIRTSTNPEVNIGWRRRSNNNASIRIKS